MNGLKAKRLERGMTQQALAEKSGVHAVMISRFEANISKPENMTLFTAARLAEALNCDPRDFLSYNA